MWGTKFKGKRILIKCDNQVTVYVINTGKSRNSCLQCCLREICFLAAVHEFEIRAVHIAGIDNCLADMLQSNKNVLHCVIKFLFAPTAKADNVEFFTSFSNSFICKSER
jgi:hypothetical protein